MAKPIIYRIEPFDNRTSGCVIKFKNLGNQSYGSILTIKNASDMTTVFTQTVTNQRCENTIPVGALLTNDEKAGNPKSDATKLCAEIVSIDENGVKSAASDLSYFWCVYTPTLKFLNMDPDGLTTIKNSNISLTAYYDSPQGDGIYSIQFFLYDSSGRVCQESDIRYDVGDDERSVVFNGLDNGENYYAEAVVLTQLGITVTTREKLFIYYQQPSAYSRIYATSNNEDGIVDWYTNIIAIEPTRTKDEYDLTSDGYIDLREDWITYNSNYKIEGDFIIGFKHKFEKSNVTLVETDAFKLELLDTGAFSYVYKLTAPGVLSDYVLYSRVIDDIELHDDVVVYIRRVDGVYEIYPIVIFGGTSIFADYNLYIGRQPSYSKLSNYNAWMEVDSTLSSNAGISHAGKNAIINDGTEPTGLTSHALWLGGD